MFYQKIKTWVTPKVVTHIKSRTNYLLPLLCVPPTAFFSDTKPENKLKLPGLSGKLSLAGRTTTAGSQFLPNHTKKA
jgi:hypothetical protein